MNLRAFFIIAHTNSARKAAFALKTATEAATLRIRTAEDEKDAYHNGYLHRAVRARPA